MADERRIAWRVNQVYFRSFVFNIDWRDVQADFTGDLFFIIIRRGRPFVHTSEARCRAGRKSKSGDQRSLPRVAVTYNSQISELLCRINSHGQFSFQEMTLNLRNIECVRDRERNVFGNAAYAKSKMRLKGMGSGK